jgi:chromosomal replication initiator protein
MDDVQFISNKDRTQEELFHLFNALYESNKQFIFSSDKHPNFIPNLEERLLSRFNAGMIVEIKPPDFESRLQIFKTKAQQMSLPLTQEVIEYLASAVEGNIRELEGVVNTILCQTQLKNKELSLMDIKNILKNNSSRPKKAIAVKDVVKTIADFYNIEEASIYEKTRKKEVVKPRQVIMYFLREELNISYPSIGEKLGGRDHTTVIHSCEKIKGELKVNSLLVQEINQLKSMIC